MGSKFIIIIVVALFFIAFVQLMKIYQLSSKVRGKRSEEKVTRNENMLMGYMMLVFMVLFFGFTIWLMFKYGANSGLYEAATVHGKKIDDLLMFNWYIILPVFFGTNFLLFFFSWKYYHREERKATFISHNNKLEFFWTVIPAAVLSFIVIYGIRTWNDIMYNTEEGQIVEIYAYQFGWRVRYAGDDNVLGKADYKLVSTSNPLGVITDANIKATYAEIDQEIEEIDSYLNQNKSESGEYLLPKSTVNKKKEKLERLKRRKYRIKSGIDKGPLNDSIYRHANDDYEDDLELRLIKGQPYTFIIRSKDVIHSPWFPHFRAQINAVPGMETNFKLTPTITTTEMREKPEVIAHYDSLYSRHQKRINKYNIEEDEPFTGLFNYVLLCNKICGASHSNMQMDVFVETRQENDYNVKFKKYQKKKFKDELNFLTESLSANDSSLALSIDTLTKELEDFETRKDKDLLNVHEILKLRSKSEEQISALMAEKDNFGNEEDYKYYLKIKLNNILNESNYSKKDQLDKFLLLDGKEAISFIQEKAEIALINFGEDLKKFTSKFDSNLSQIQKKILTQKSNNADERLTSHVKNHDLNKTNDKVIM